MNTLSGRRGPDYLDAKEKHTAGLISEAEEVFGAFSDATRYWSAAESNSMVPPFEGALMVNRLFVAGLALVALGIAYWRYSFAEKGLSARKLKKEQAKAEAAS